MNTKLDIKPRNALEWELRNCRDMRDACMYLARRAKRRGLLESARFHVMEARHNSFRMVGLLRRVS